MGGEPFMNPEVAQFYNNIVNTSSNEPYEDVIRFLEFVRNSEVSEDCILNMRQDASSLVSADVTQQIIERHMKFLLLVQFEYTRSLPSHDPDSIDSNLSEWVCVLFLHRYAKAAQILERLSVCSLTQSNWKDFIKKDLVDRLGFFCNPSNECFRYASSHGKTLAQIYMNIGLEPPSCLPHLDEPDDDSGNDNDRVIDNPSSFSLVDLEDPLISVEGPKTPTREMLSPRTAKISARNSLPRALFTDSFVLTQNEGLSWFSASQISPE
ncbi:unnamed protein product [Hydatigera taeniaeformis]|uniref:CTLH domain-containing protein n=1 Tax=Hydatigena taeniaeformis TaxID=6205 RepID=A0A0R3X2M5_HYDTA|nr:unnamed protein product [Hydatigera taeniaeformis]